MSNTNQYLANCPISTITPYPETEIVPFNGFAWSNSQGLIHQSNLVQTGDPLTTLGE